MKTRLERELAAQQSGLVADAMFSHACARLGLNITTARIAPLASIVLAESEIDAERLRNAALCGND